MAVLFDYLDWRGDLSFDADPANEADYYLISKILLLICNNYLNIFYIFEYSS